jgi:hypothetical protein
MNHSDHITHYKGQPIKYMTNHELQSALIAEMKAYAELMDAYTKQIMKSGRTAIEQNRA